MAAVVRHHSRGVLAALRLPLMRSTLIASILPGSFVAPKPTNWTIPTLESLLELLPPWLLAVPKKKTSHSRKAMRSANKGLKDKRNLVHCPGCGSPKLAHHLCPSCYSGLSRAWKGKGGQGEGSEIPTIHGE